VLPNVNKWDLDLDQKMWSIGLRAGLDTVWHFTKHWGLYGNLSISPLWTSFDSRAKQIETVRANTASPFLNVTTQNTSAKNQQIVTVIEMSLGLTYMTWFYKDRYQLTLQAGWEEQVWMDYNLLINTVEYRAGNMNIQGLTVKAGFEF
ncbi:MAG: Lpg1974 family pore-forming outer membrane protein, partial [Parachlamydiales bacterium]